MDSFDFPHVRFINSAKNHNPHNVYRTYNGYENHLINGKIYTFFWTSYSPDKDTKYKDILVSIDEDNDYIQSDWVKINYMMYRCWDCREGFTKLLEIKEKDKMLQLCPFCKSENVDLIKESEKENYLREKKLRRVLKKKLKDNDTNGDTI